MALSDATNHEQSICAILHTPVLPVHTLQWGAVHVQIQALCRDTDGNVVPVSIRETRKWDPTQTY